MAKEKEKNNKQASIDLVNHRNEDYALGECLFVIYYHNHKQNAKLWHDRLLAKNADVYIMDSGSGDHIDGSRSIITDNIYYGGLFHNTIDYARFFRKKWIFIICDDIEIDDENFEKMFSRIGQIIESDTNIGVYQPSSTEDSRNLYDRNKNKGTGALRAVPGMEGWMLLFRISIIESLGRLNVDYRTYLSKGWAIDLLTSYQSFLDGFVNVIDDGVIVKHPQGPGGYDQQEAAVQMNAMWQRLGIEYFQLEGYIGGRIALPQIRVSHKHNNE